jgi:nucleotide-binding universal stress UspA family protein
MQRILVPVDGSDASVRAAQFAAELARLGHGEILLVHVYDLPAATAMGIVTAVTGTQLDDTRARVAQASFARAKEVLGGVQVSEHLVELGHPAERIVAAALEHRCTHIVMGSRGLSPFKGTLLGSVSERVVGKAPCPVTLVR